MSAEAKQSTFQFAPRGPFFEAIKARVDQYFVDAGKRSTGDWRLHSKTAFAFALFAGSYAALVWWVDSLWATVVAAFLLAQALVLIGFNVMHDGAHGSYSRKPWLNWLMGATMELLGSSQMLWRQKHNLLHHTYTNVDGKDDDISVGALFRLSPNQRWYPWHRVQHWYAAPLYSVFSLYLVFYADWKKVFTGRIGTTPMQKPSRRALLGFFGAKAAYFAYAIGLPALFHPLWQVLLVFVGVHLVVGLTVSVVFQLAHTVGGTQFQDGTSTAKIPDEWAVHQCKTTANFAPQNRLATFYLGGLNFQIEHHLCHRISHVHYPAIAKIVSETCREFAVPYESFPSVRSAIAEHFRFLKQLGRAPAAA
jgi:linoleoyl-CoA desaturase